MHVALRWIPFHALCVVLAASASAGAATRCDRLLTQLNGKVVDAICFESPDLTTNNPNTTPANNSLPGVPPFAFTPQTDSATIAPDPAHRTPITKAVPGLQLDGRIADDPAGEARILLRLPDQWNGKLVVAGASGTRSEFNGDIAWSNYVVQQGYAYVSQNKGVLNLTLATAADPLACRLNPTSPVFVHFFANDAATPFTRWTEVMVETARLGREALAANYGRHPRHTYAVGTSNGGYQVRRAMETAPDLFDGGVDWEGTFVDPAASNILMSLPPAIRPTSSRGRSRSGASIRRSSGRARSVSGRSGSTQPMPPTSRGPGRTITLPASRLPTSAPTSPRSPPPARSAGR